MGKMKELAYTVERLDGLFQYLELLYKLNECDRILAVCDEIEKELGIVLPKRTIDMDIDVEKLGRSTSELADIIAKGITRLGTSGI